MEQVTVTITTNKPVNVKITPCKDALCEILDALDGEMKEGDGDVAEGEPN